MRKRAISGRTDERSNLEIEGLLRAFRSEQVRWLVSREEEIKRNSRMSDESFKQLLLEIVRREADRSIIVSQLRKSGEGTVGDIAASIKITERQILKHMIALMKRGSVAMVGEKEDEYVFTTVEPPE